MLLIVIFFVRIYAVRISEYDRKLHSNKYTHKKSLNLNFKLGKILTNQGLFLYHQRITVALCVLHVAVTWENQSMSSNLCLIKQSEVNKIQLNISIACLLKIFSRSMLLMLTPLLQFLPYSWRKSRIYVWLLF